ncbi:aminopeptidase, partial [Pseudoalteromonas sp. DL2-H6]|nr:aminopeptidase [Pseudoalteromonas sp. DL2-H6]
LWIDKNQDITDFYDSNDQFTVTNEERNEYREFLSELKPWEKRTLERAVKEDKNYYVLKFGNVGGLVMPILLELTYQDGSKEERTIPAEIWRRNARNVSKLIITDKDKPLASVTVDPRWETADVDIENNHYPRRIIESRLELYKKKEREGKVYRDIMQDVKAELKPLEEKKDN